MVLSKIDVKITIVFISTWVCSCFSENWNWQANSFIFNKNKMYSFIKGFALVKNSLHFHDRSALGIIHKLKQFAVPFEIYAQSPPNPQSLQLIHCSLAELTNSPSHSSHLLTQYTTTQTSPPASYHHPQAERNYSFSPDIIFPKICFAWKKGKEAVLPIPDLVFWVSFQSFITKQKPNNWGVNKSMS